MMRKNSQMRWRSQTDAFKVMSGITMAIVLVALIAIPAQALTITPEFKGDWTDDQKHVINNAVNDWAKWLCPPYNVTITFEQKKLEENVLGEWEYEFNIAPGVNVRPWTEGISHTIFLSDSDSMFWSKDPVEDGKWDAWTVVRHEIGHALGFVDGVYLNNDTDPWAGQITDNVFDQSGLNVPMLDGDFSHIDWENDLMYTTIVMGQRREIEMHHLQMLKMAYGYCIVPEPATIVLLSMGIGGLAFRKWRRRSIV